MTVTNNVFCSRSQEIYRILYMASGNIYLQSGDTAVHFMANVLVNIEILIRLDYVSRIY